MKRAGTIGKLADDGSMSISGTLQQLSDYLRAGRAKFARINCKLQVKLQERQSGCEWIIMTGINLAECVSVASGEAR